MPGGWISVISRPTREVPEMRDLPGLNGAWTEERQEERHDVYKYCAFADWRRDTGADPVWLHSHQVVA